MAVSDKEVRVCTEYRLIRNRNNPEALSTKHSETVSPEGKKRRTIPFWSIFYLPYYRRHKIWARKWRDISEMQTLVKKRKKKNHNKKQLTSITRSFTFLQIDLGRLRVAAFLESWCHGGTVCLGLFLPVAVFPVCPWSELMLKGTKYIKVSTLGGVQNTVLHNEFMVCIVIF